MPESGLLMFGLDYSVEYLAHFWNIELWEAIWFPWFSASESFHLYASS